MKKIKWVVTYIFYHLVAKRLPSSNSPISLGSMRVRRFCVKNMIQQCGRNVNIEHGAKFSRLTKIGNYSGIGINARLYGEVIIGDYVMMGPDCIIYTQNHEFSNTEIPMCKQGFQEQKPVHIGNDVWIGGRVIILPGVKIGNGVIIGAGTVVTKDIEDNLVVGGNPMKVIKKRGKTNE